VKDLNKGSIIPGVAGGTNGLFSFKTVDALVILLASFVVYHDYWALNKLFTGNDFFQAFAPVINFQSDCLREMSWPLWNPFINFGYPWVGHYLNTTLFPSHLLLGTILKWTVEVYQLEILVWTVLGGVGVYLCTTEAGASRRAGVVAGISFMLSGQMIALPHWGSMVYNASCFPFIIYGYLRASRNDDPFSIISIAFLTMSILGGYVPSTVLAVYLASGYVVLDTLNRKKVFFGIKFLLLTISLTGLLVLPKMVPLYTAMGTSPRLETIYSDPRFGIIAVDNFMTFLLPVKFYFSLYVGSLLLIGLIHSFFRRTFRIDPLLVMAVLSGWLLLAGEDGGPLLLRLMANASLPFIRLIRLEFIYWYYPLTFAVLFLAHYLEGFIAEQSARFRAFAVAVFAAALSAAFFSAYNTDLHLKAYMTHLSIAVLFFGAGFVGKKQPLRTALFIGLVIADFAFVFNSVNIDVPPVRQGSSLHMVLSDQNYISRSFMDDEKVKDRMPLTITDDRLRPSVSDSRQWAYLVPMTPATPVPNYTEILNQKRFTGWWYNNQETFDFTRLKDSPLFRELENAPLFAVFDRNSGGVVTDAAIFNAISCSGFSFSVDAPAPGFFLLHQMYDDRWKVRIDGKEEIPLRANDFFMGAEIASGPHSIEFRFRDRSFILSLVVSLATTLGMAAAGIRRTARRRRQKNAAA